MTNPIKKPSGHQSDLVVQRAISLQRIQTTKYQTLPCINNLTTATYKIFVSHSRSHPNIIISSDLNLGDIDWSEDPPSTTNSLTSRDMSSLLEYIANCALTQRVIEPTRPTLDGLLIWSSLQHQPLSPILKSALV